MKKINHWINGKNVAGADYFHTTNPATGEEAGRVPAADAAAVAAGGRVVDDSQAPSFTVVADQDGNKACVCTSLPPAKRD